MQHLGSEELQRVWRQILAETPPEERLEGLSAEERLKGHRRRNGLLPR
jgi:hypothetical protein